MDEDRFAKHSTRFDAALKAREERYAAWEVQAPIVKATLEEVALWLNLNSRYFRQVGLNVHETCPQIITDRQVVLQARSMSRITLETGDFDLAVFSAQSGSLHETLQEHGFALQFNPTWNGKIYVVVTGYSRDYTEDESFQEILHICENPVDITPQLVQELLDKALEVVYPTCHLFEGKPNEPIHLSRIGFKSKNGAEDTET
ncbi:MAG: hypothetical protein KF690_10650 [Bacteroidetes bacterium]|nr:hypothetical protein [Bacteroidota bacterium]